jgi:hypothetical protein
MPQTPSPAQLLALVDDPLSATHLRTYFGTDRPGGAAQGFTGSRFEFLAGGGDRPDSADRITADDLLAVQLLSVEVPGEVVLDELERPLGDEVNAQLADIPTDVSIGTPAAAALLADGGPADAAWRLLRARTGMGWVTTSKLLARKRPRLIPVYDNVVRCAFGELDRWWRWLDAGFAEDGGALPRRLTALRDATAVDASVTPLRVLDVIVWMRHRRPEHQARGCAGLRW